MLLSALAGVLGLSPSWPLPLLQAALQMAPLRSRMGPQGPPCPAQSGAGSVSTMSSEQAGEKENAVLAQFPSEGNRAVGKQGPIMEAVKAAWSECHDQAQGWEAGGLAVSLTTTSFETRTL